MSLIVQKENCVVEEIKEVELRSRRGKFIYNRTYNYIGLNQVSRLYFRQDKLPSNRDCNSKLALFSHLYKSVPCEQQTHLQRNI